MWHTHTHILFPLQLHWHNLGFIHFCVILSCSILKRSSSWAIGHFSRYNIMEKSVDILKSFIISLAMLIQYEKIKDKARKYENGWTLANYIAPRIHPATDELSQKWIKPSSLNTYISSSLTAPASKYRRWQSEMFWSAVLQCQHIFVSWVT